MNLTEIAQAIEQYKNEGQDMHQVMALTQSLMDSGKTPLGLNQWKLMDKPRMEEFNEDNRIVDEVLRELQEKLSHNLVMEEQLRELREELEKKANIGAPQKFSFPFANGNIDRAGKSIYVKNQERLVTVSIMMQTNPITDTIGRNYLLGTLPVGYRPSSNHAAGALGHKADMVSSVTTSLGVRTNGDVYADVYGGQVAAVFGQVSFYVDA